MAQYFFGKAFTYSHSVYVDTAEALDSIVSARLYSSKPTSAQIEDDSDSEAVEIVNSWSAGAETNEYDIAFAAVTDSTPHSTTAYERYYVVVRFKMESGGETKHTLEAIKLYRPQATITRYDVAASDVYDHEPKIETIKGDSWTETRITSAEEWLEKKFLADRRDTLTIDREDAHQLLKALATALCCNALAAEEGDVWDLKYSRWMSFFEDFFRTLPIKEDIDKDGLAEPGEVRDGGIVYLGRI